jgi:hypothetical protein
MKALSLFLTLTLAALANETEVHSDKSWKDYLLFDVDLSYVTMHRSIDNADNIIDSNVNDILNVSLLATLFPKEYDLQIGYSHNLTNNVDKNLYNPRNYNNNVEHFLISAKPYYNEQYGGLGIFYTMAQQNSSYTNKSGATLMLNEYSGTTMNNTGTLSANQGYKSKEKASYLGIKYLLPEYKYLPKGANIYYSIMDRTTVYYGRTLNDATDHLIYMSGKGNMYGFGLQRELYELPMNELSLDLVQISKGSFSDFPNLDLLEYTAGATYKSEHFYVKAFALVYIAQEFNSNMGGMQLHIPKMTDIMGTIKVGTSF